jgi:hypothetical protein
MSAALTFGLLVPLTLIVLVLLVVVVLVDRRDDLDPDGRRPFAAYVFVVVFLTLFTTLFALASMVGSLVHLAVGDDGSSASRRAATTQTSSGNDSTITLNGGDGETSSQADSSDADDAHIREAVRAGLLAAAAGGVLFFHLGMARRAADDPAVGAGPARRIYHAYLYAATALAVIIVVGAGTALGYAIFKVIAPGVASSSGVGERKDALPDLAASAVLVAGAAFIFLYHYRRRPNIGGGAVAALPPAPDAFAPPPGPEPERPSPQSKRPVRRAPAAKKTTTRRTSRAE